MTQIARKQIRAQASCPQRAENAKRGSCNRCENPAFRDFTWPARGRRGCSCRRPRVTSLGDRGHDTSVGGAKAWSANDWERGLVSPTVRRVRERVADRCLSRTQQESHGRATDSATRRILGRVVYKAASTAPAAAAYTIRGVFCAAVPAICAAPHRHQSSPRAIRRSRKCAARAVDGSENRGTGAERALDCVFGSRRGARLSSAGDVFSHSHPQMSNAGRGGAVEPCGMDGFQL